MPRLSACAVACLAAFLGATTAQSTIARGPVPVSVIEHGQSVRPLEIAQVFADGSIGQWHPCVVKSHNENPAASSLEFGAAETTKLRGPGPEFVPTEGRECGGFDPVCAQTCSQARRVIQSCAFTYGGIRISAVSSVNSSGERGNVGQVFLAWTNKRGAGERDDFMPPRVIGDTVIEILLYDQQFDPNCGPFQPNLVGGVLVNFGPLDGQCGPNSYYFSTINLREFADVCLTIPGPAAEFGYEVAFWYDAQRSARAANNQAVMWGIKNPQQQGVTSDLGYIDTNYDGEYSPPGECLPLEGGGCPPLLAAAVDFWGDTDQGVLNLWDNGTFVTQFQGGCANDDISVIEPPSTSGGFNTRVSEFRKADDFSVPTGQVWQILDARWYLHQTDSNPNEPITAAYVQVWDGPPGDGGTRIAGDMTTNRLIASEFMQIYRVTQANQTSCSRAVKRITVDMSWLRNLSAGSYWIELGAEGNPSFSGPFAIPTVPRNEATDNARSFQVSTNTWSAAIDSTSGLPYDLPFELTGKIISGGGCEIAQYTLAIDGTCPGTVRLSWENAAPQTQQGIIYGRRLGSTTIPPGSNCQGTVLGIEGSVRLVNIINTGPTGNGTVSGQTNSGACHGYLQLVESGSCRTSNVAQLP